jgi:hypothetical protein
LSHTTVVIIIVAMLALFNLVELGRRLARSAQWNAAQEQLNAAQQLAEARPQAAEAITFVPCPDCSTTCEFCGGAGKTRCEMSRCGGEGFLTIAAQPCTAPGCRGETGKILVGCTLCTETGVEVLQRADCPCCHGTKLQSCGKCQGSGRMSTGRVGGALPARFGDREPADCPTCAGQGRIRKPEPKKTPQGLTFC